MIDDEMKAKFLTEFTEASERPAQDSATWKFVWRLIEHLIINGMPVDVAFDVGSRYWMIGLDDEFDDAFIDQLMTVTAGYLLRQWQEIDRTVKAVLYRQAGRDYSKASRLAEMLFLRSI